jgi:hypothetical protein
MEFYQCPDCLGVHEEAAEPILGLFVRCESCLLEASLSEVVSSTASDDPHELELVAGRAA